MNIGYNFGIDDGTGSKFGTHKELIVLNILKYNFYVYKSRDMWRDHFAKIVNYYPIGGRLNERRRLQFCPDKVSKKVQGIDLTETVLFMFWKLTPFD